MSNDGEIKFLPYTHPSERASLLGLLPCPGQTRIPQPVYETLEEWEEALKLIRKELLRDLDIKNINARSIREQKRRLLQKGSFSS